MSSIPLTPFTPVIYSRHHIHAHITPSVVVQTHICFLSPSLNLNDYNRRLKPKIVLTKQKCAHTEEDIYSFHLNNKNTIKGIFSHLVSFDIILYLLHVWYFYFALLFVCLRVSHRSDASTSWQCYSSKEQQPPGHHSGFCRSHHCGCDCHRGSHLHTTLLRPAEEVRC